MRKVYISFLLVFCLIINCSAAGETNNWFNVLAFATANNSGQNYVVNTASGVQANFGLPTNRTVYQVDALIYTNTSGFSIQLGRYGGDVVSNATITSLGNNMYRVSGSLNGYTAGAINLKFSGGSSGAVYQILSLNILSMPVQYFSTSISSVLTDGYSSKTAITGNAIYSYTSSSLVSSGNPNFKYEIKLTDYYKYDYYDVFIRFSGAAISSVNVDYSSGISVPFTCSLYFSSEESLVTPYWNSSLDYVLYDYSGYSACEMMLHLDLSGVPRNSDGRIDITIDGNYVTSDGMMAQTVATTGILNTENVPLVSVWFMQLKNWLTSGFNSVVAALNVGGSSGSDFNDSVSDQANEMDDLNDQLQDVTKPSIDDIESSVSDYVSDSDVNDSTAPLLEIFNSSIFSSVIMMDLILALGSYVLYGKR